MEAKLAKGKAELKEMKEEVRVLIEEMERTGRELAEREFGTFWAILCAHGLIANQQATKTSNSN